MTQPAPPPSQPTNGQVVAAAAVGLALVAVEARVREQIQDDLDAALDTVAAVLIIALAAGILTGTELLSRHDVHTATTTALDTAADTTSAAIQAAYAAAAQIALVKAQRELKKAGHDVPSTLPDLGGASTALIGDIDLAYSQGKTDLQNTVRDAVDGIQGDNPGAARTVAVNAAVTAVGKRLGQRVQATGSTAVHQGANDALNAIYADFATINPYVTLRKRWHVTAADPCGVCRALDGTTVAVGAEFDHDAGRDTGDWRHVWRNLQGPPRHPHCRCQLELVMT
jgi:hypothetical protein